MTVYQILTLARPIFEALIAEGVNMKDAQFIDLYADYIAMHENGEKTAYIEAVLCERYGIKRAKFYLILRSFQTEVSMAL